MPASTLKRDIVVIGASSGAVQTFHRVRGLPEDFPASLPIVVHVAPTGESLVRLREEEPA